MWYNTGMKMTGIYIRTSTERQEKGYESQERAIRAYCEIHSIMEIKVYGDFGISGVKEERNGLNELIRDCKDGKIERVIVYSFSRFARSTSHLLKTLELFKNLKVSFISVTEKIDTSTPMGLALFTIVSAISQLERDLVSERVKNGLVNAKAKGKSLGRPKKVNDLLAVELVKAGKTYEEISRIIGSSPASISRAFKKYGGKINEN